MTKMRMWSAAIALVAATTLVGAGAAPEQQAPAITAASAQGLRAFSSALIDVDYQSASLRTVLRQMAEIGGANLVVDASVPSDAVVDLKLTQVPWYQVMEVVMRTGALTFTLDGTVLRVLTKDALTDEYTKEANAKKASEQAPDLATARIRLNYATAKDVAVLLKDLGFAPSGRGAIQSEDRTNMLVIQELPRNLEDIRALVADLDRAEPQVEIEAKILRTNRDTAKALGVQWGFNGRMASELGNTSPMAFPNNGTVGGRITEQGAVTQGPQDPRATALERVGTAINMPVPGASSALGLSMGAINGAFGLDVALSALERQGTAKILSTPRVTTQNNKEAEITQGFEVPIQIVANNTVTVQFKPAALKLTVTPQITAANTVIMRIFLENATPDFSRAVNGNPSINTQRATTQVQVGDGSTTVIGGILQTQETSSTDSTPGLSQLPLLGWLFKRTDNRSENSELLIFITPRIIRG
jgi:type IV pilus assembly protein PilQ